MKTTGYHGALLAAYSFLQEFGRVRPDAEYWEAVTQTGSNISKKYQNTPLAPLVNALLIAVHNELQRQYGAQFSDNRPVSRERS